MIQPTKIAGLFLGSLLLLNACSSSKKLAKQAEAEEIMLPELQVIASAEPTPYFASETRINDLLHTKLEVAFDWEKQQLIGQATLDFQPYFYPTDALTLDAKGFEIKEVSLFQNGQKKPLDYKYDGAFIEIKLDKKYTRDEKYSIFIDYIAKPNELEAGGSAAITEDKGLYFINADGSEEGKPQQIWTQGETEASSCWFPTIDAPNEKTTQEIFMTVQDKYVTLSNGKLMRSTPKSNGMRTDYWKQDIPHTPYLFALFVGDMAVVKDKNWNGKEVYYIVEKEYEPYALEIFGNTPEMLDFYSDLLGYAYPWDKYAQVVVRDFVSGAMENTTATIHFDGLNKDSRELLDETHEDIVAHELFHHWFGDLVTCESWPNLPLNESFATYGEYLWIEYKYGKDAADYHGMRDLQAYMQESEGKKVELIRYRLDDKEDMFDAHSYQKGGRVLHMLRNYLGDDAFFAGINLYLQDNEFEAAEIHHLRLAFEEISGEDLNWFFNQWFLGAGHPILDISYDFDAELGKYMINVEQTQDENPFVLPLAVDLYFADGKVKREKIKMTERAESFAFDVTEQPILVNFDADKILLGETNDAKDAENYLVQLQKAPLFKDRMDAVRGLKDEQGNADVDVALATALNDDFWAVRGATISVLAMDSSKIDLINRLKRMATDDEKSAVRSEAINKLSEISGITNVLPVFETAINDSSYVVMAAGLKALTNADAKKGLAVAEKYENSKKGTVVRALAGIYGEHATLEKVAFFEEQLTKGEDYSRFLLAENYGALLSRNQDETAMEKGVATLKKLAMNDRTWWVRLNGMRALSNMRGSLEGEAQLAEEGSTEKATLETKIAEMTKEIEAVRANETNPRLLQFYQMQVR